MKKKFYGVKVGKKIGIYDTWEECKKNVIGYSNSVYKSFGSYEEAKNFIKQSEITLLQTPEKYDIVAYIDGSYSNDKCIFSYGGLYFYKNKKYQFAYKGEDKNLVSLRNVAGELKATIYVVEFALENNVKNILINYDYTGIENWAKENWKANLEFTKYYSKFMRESMKRLVIEFKKIKSHTGDKYNEEADKLAKRGLEEDYFNISEIDN